MTDEFVSQFGETFYKSSDGTNVSPSSALAGKDYIMLYFSAKWCGPCRMFTPKLIEFYEKIKLTKNVEVVFCSLDNEEEEYKQYTSKMPWLSMPFKAEQSRTMADKYGCEGIPHLVVVDGATGELITDDGTSQVRSDPEGAKFPWKPKPFSELWPSQILSSKGSDEKFLNSDTLKDKYLMLYFSAHWCPPCRAFTPKLSKFYEKLKAQRSDFELVFLSSDRDEEAFNEYFDTMSFCALPYEHRDEKAALSKMFKVSGIPMLIMLGPVGETGNRPVINTSVRGFVEKDEFAEFPFHKRNYGDVGGAEDLQDAKAVIIFHENGDDDEQDEIKAIAKEAAAKAKEAGKEINVYWSLSPGGLGARIRSLVGLPEVSEDPAMIMLDIPKYYKSAETEVTVDKIMAFIETPGETFSLE